jgi:acyl-CoA thioesterase-1
LSDAGENASLRLVVIGASVMSGFGLGDSRALERELIVQAAHDGVTLTIENRSRAGATLKDGAQALAQMARAGKPPDRVLITLGLGDAYYGVTVDGLRRDLDLVVQRATSIVSPGQVFIVRQVLFQPTLLARTDVHTQRRWPSIFDEVGRQHGVEVLPFFLREVMNVPHLKQTDGIHPNVDGAATVAHTLWADMQATASAHEVSRT